MPPRLKANLNRTLLIVAAAALLGGGLRLLLRPAQVTTAEVTVRRIAPVIQGVGTVEAKVVVQLAAKITGRIVNLSVDQGDTVRTGQALVHLENAELSAEVERAAANLDRAKLAVAAQQAALLRAQAGLAAADAAITKAQSNQSIARVNAERWRKLSASNLVAQMDLDERINVAQSADAELRSAEAFREAAVKEVAVQEVSVQIARRDIAAAQAALAAVEAKKADSVITSPIAGYVVSRELESGSAVNPGTPILKLVDPSTIWITAYVDARDAGPITVGNVAEVALRSLPGRTFPAKVVRIRRESDRVTEQWTVDLSLDEQPARLTLGEQAEAIIRLPVKEVTALPLAAVVQSPNGTGAWTVVDGRLRFRQARLGAVDPGGWSEVLEGFAGGEQVVIAPGKLADLKNEGRRVAATLQGADAATTQRPRP